VNEKKSGSYFNDLLNIDEVDKKIISLLQENPEMTHSQISEKVHKSQPAVGARIIKMKRKNLLCTQIGVNMAKIDIKLAKVEMLTKDAEAVLKKVEQCPFVLHAFKVSGPTNLCVMIAAPDIQTIDNMVDRCYRTDPNVNSANVSYIIHSVKDLILPINFNIEHFNETGCGVDCIANTGEIDRIKELVNKSREEALKRELISKKIEKQDK